MAFEVNPIEAAFAVLLFFLFLFLLATWCCRQCSRTKDVRVNLVPHPVQPRYVETVDVQTGLPVVVDIESLGNLPRNHGTVSQQQRRMSYPVSVRRQSMYGAMDQQIFPRTPPPAYSEVVEIHTPNRT
ncbi:hypothetical protein JTE90_014758 [Oedothorax gibbosus]|uniref:Secreted protein n=1 Tax=Oedothorax gibbosus TaxID=931172 RepID=A0AAV6USF3_9ARAC|nr:hypothetical protein JTE90_014758 [Oedothorax gibbosus]